MGRKKGCNKSILLYLTICGVVIYSIYSFYAQAQYKESKLAPPPPIQSTLEDGAQVDSSAVRFPVKSDIPTTYEEMFSDGGAMDLATPTNITTTTEYDYETGHYVIRTKLGDTDISTPFMLTADEYSNNELRKSMTEYYRMRNAELVAEQSQKEFDFMNMNFSLGPLEKVFGPGGVQLKMQGTVQLKTGIKTNTTENPAVSVASRTKSYFDFEQTIQASVAATVGSKMKFNMTYNTDATFDFDSQSLKLQFDGEEDDIIKNIEAGNVSMTTGSSLIKGSTSLFGIKSTMQFGKLTATALVSQQNSESQTVNTSGGVQTSSFSINCDEYDSDRHFFLSHYFRENYDDFASTLPYVLSGISITKIEVWKTNKAGDYDESRNIVAFMDMGENKYLANDYWTPSLSYDNPSSSSNNLLTLIKSSYDGARDINSVTETLSPLSVYGIDGGQDYEKLQSAQLLSSSDYTLNESLGYISLKSALSSDEVLAVAFEYTYKGTVYQVGEFSSDITTTDNALYVKMLKSTTADPKLPMWKLMMKNVYSLGAYQLQEDNFSFNIYYQSDSIGTEILYLPVGNISTTPLLQVMNLDRLDATSQSNPDGFFDYLDGYTVNASTGRVIFPVAEPFGSYLEEKIGDATIASSYVYKELYDSTLTVAQQLQEKNKFVLSGEYQASSGSQISLNAMNVSRGSVVVTAGGVTLTENSDYTVDYNMGIVTIINQSIIDAGTNISVSLENQSVYSMQRKTLLGLDLNYAVNQNLNIGGTIMHFSESSVTEKVSVGNETINNTIWGMNMSYNKSFMWLTNLLNAIPTVNATAPSTISLSAEFAQLVPHTQESGSTEGSSYLDDFESTQTGIDLRSPYSWFLSATPYDTSSDALFPESLLSNNLDYGKNRALLSWYYIDDLFTNKNSTLAPGYIKNDYDQQSSPYVREVTTTELYPDMELSYGESTTIQTLNLSFYPSERGPYNLDSDNIDDQGYLLTPEDRWGGIMRKLDNTNFETSNIEYITFWMLSPFLDDENTNYDGGDLYFNLGEVSEDILKDGMKSYENGVDSDDDTYMYETVWGKVSTQTSLTYAFDSSDEDRVKQDVGLNGLHTDDELTFSSYSDFLTNLRLKLSAATIAQMEADDLSVLNDPASDNYHFYRGYDYDAAELSILERYKRYNGVEGNSLSSDYASDALYQSARSVPDVEDINQDNTLNEYERYYQYHISIRPEDFVVGQNYITDKQVSSVSLRNGEYADMEWYQFKIPLDEYEKVVGSISDFSSIRFIRMFMTGFKNDTHLRFATLELVRGEWRTYDYSLDSRTDTSVSGSIDVSTVNIEENAGREPVNYILPPGVTRVVDSSQSQVTQLNEQSMSLTLTDIDPGDARGVYKNSSIDLRLYKRLQMFVHAEAVIDDVTNLADNDLSVFVRMGSDVKNNYYEYEIPLTITPAGTYSTYNSTDQYTVWPLSNQMDCELDQLINLKSERIAAATGGTVSLTETFSMYDPNYPDNKISILGSPSLSDVDVMLIGVRNNSSTVKDAVVWINELKVTDFDEDGGWAAKGSLNLTLSDIATVNVSGYKETSGFGAVDESLSSRATDDLEQYNVAVQVDLGRFLPEKVKLKAPVYYSVSNEKTTPKYNPLDQDVLLEDALEAATSEAARDSILTYAISKSISKNLSVSGLKFDIQSKKPKPWDPANLTLSYSSSKSSNSDSTTEYENQSDYRGSLDYNYSPYVKGLTPFSFIKSKSKDLKFIKEWELNYLPSSIGFYNNISRYYYELQSRNLSEVLVDIPVSVSKNFIWDRSLSLSWNLTKQLTMTFNSNTTAYIQETVGAVDKDLYPTEYECWRDTVWNSIKNLGDPQEYNQTFSASYKLPFSKIPSLSFISGSVSYNASYDWDKGVELDGEDMGNTISNQSIFSVEGKFNFEQLYNKSKYLKEVNSKFSSTTRRTNSATNKMRKFTRTFMLKEDEELVVKHNMKTQSVKVTATTTAGKPYPIKFEVIDANSVKILTKAKSNVKITVTEVPKETSIWSEIGEYASRAAMSVRNASFSYKRTQSLSLPQFTPEVGDVFGQNNGSSILSPGLDFAFGFIDESYIDKAKENNWLLCDDTQTTPAIWSDAKAYSFEINLEPIQGLKIKLSANQTDNRTNQTMFMYDTPTVTYSGSYVKTHCIIGTSLYTPSSSDGYQSDVFDKFLENIDVISSRIEAQYEGVVYPSTGFLDGSSYSNKTYNSENGGVRTTSSDVTIPAFMAAYTGTDAETTSLSVFPSLLSLLPNWRITYDGLVKMGNMKNIFKSFTLSHAYQCTYSVGSFTSYTDWVSVGGDLGFIEDELTESPIPSSPYEISSVTLTEKFSPLIGLSATLQNNLTLSAEYNDGRTLTLSSSAGQLVEATTNGLVIGVGYKIVDFNTIIKIGGSQKGVSNDLTLNFDFSLSNSQALIRNIEYNTAQASSGTRTIGINILADYILSKRVTVGAYYDMQSNNPLVSSTSYPTSSSNYGIIVSLSLAK